MNRKQLLICLALGAVVSAFPLILTSLPGTSPTLDKMQQASSLLLLPSLPLSIALSQGNIHDSNLWVMGLFDCVFYTAVFYLLTRWFAKRRNTSAKASIKLQAIAAVILLGGISTHAQGPEAEMFQNAQRLYVSGKLAETETKFTEITRDHPANIAAQMYLGQTLFKEEKYAAAIVPYERVRALEKAGTQSSLTQQRVLGDQLAMAYGLSGRSSDAKALLQESVRIDPGYPLRRVAHICPKYHEIGCPMSRV